MVIKDNVTAALESFLARLEAQDLMLGPFPAELVEMAEEAKHNGWVDDGLLDTGLLGAVLGLRRYATSLVFADRLPGSVGPTSSSLIPDSITVHVIGGAIAIFEFTDDEQESTSFRVSTAERGIAHVLMFVDPLEWADPTKPSTSVEDRPLTTELRSFDSRMVEAFTTISVSASRTEINGERCPSRFSPRLALTAIIEKVFNPVPRDQTSADNRSS